MACVFQLPCGYSKLLIDEQKERLRQLTDIVLATREVGEATNEELVRLPTGDGMALVFRNSLERTGAMRAGDRTSPKGTP